MSEPVSIEGDIQKPKKNGKRLAVVEASPVVSAVSSDAAWLQTVERLAPSIGIEGVRELMIMRRDERAQLAEREFNAAMAEAQAALIPVARNQTNKQTSSKYTDMAAIAEAAMPIIHQHGFGATTSEFESKKPDHLGVALKVTHRAGHSERYEFNIPFDGTGMKGNPNKTATHAYGSTLQYGERYAKCKVFGIATKDDDGNAAGAKPTEAASTEQLSEIDRLIQKTKTNIPIFCAMLGVDSADDIKSATISQAAMAIRMLKLKAGEMQE